MATTAAAATIAAAKSAKNIMAHQHGDIAWRKSGNGDEINEKGSGSAAMA